MNCLKVIEILGLFFGATYITGAILEKKWCWYAGIMATILYAIGVFYGKLYGEFILQFFYLFISIYGLLQWNKNTIVANKLKISFSSFKYLSLTFLWGFILSAGFYFLLIYFNGDYPFWDAITSGFGITTTFLVAKKKIENWLFWIIIDIILSSILYLKGYSFYSVLYLIYALFAILGFYKWYKKYLNINKKIPS